MLAPEVAKIIGVPDGYIDRDNNAFMTNFSFLMDDLIEAVAPGAIVEIGSAEGNTSRHLASLASRIGATLHVVDPILSARSDFGTGTRCHAMKSRDFLGLGVKAAVWVIDGDHNYDTVMLELVGAWASREEGKPFLAFLHDVSWPSGRRDMFYDIADAKGDFLVDHDARLEGGIPLIRPHLPKQKIAIRVDEGGPRNGVVAAVEDFTAGNPGRFSYAEMTGFFGLGLLYETDTFPVAAAERLHEVMAAHAKLQPLLAALEANRLRLLQSHFDAMDEAARLEGKLQRIRSLPMVGTALALYRRFLKDGAPRSA